MTLVYRSICVEIDEVTINIMHLCEKLIHYKLIAQKVMNNGFVNIAKARYIMGTKCVSTLQLPTINSNPIQPVVTVSRSQRQDYWEFKADRRKPSPIPSDEKVSKEKIKTDTTEADVMKKLIEQDLKNIRKRKEFYLVEDGNYSELNDELQDGVSTSSSESAESLVTFTDPIRLFGVLVPYTLRVAQKNFQEVVDVILTCATIQSEMDAVLKRYHHLIKVKRLIEKAAEERNFDLSEEKEYWTPSEKSEETYEIITDVPSDHSTLKESEVEKEQEQMQTKSETEKDELCNEDNFEIPGEEQIIFHEDSAESINDGCKEELESDTEQNSDSSTEK